MGQSMAEYLVQQGKAEGRTEEKQAVVLKLLQLRFGSVPESVTNQVRLTRSFSRLDALFEKALTSRMLKDIDLLNHYG